LPCWAAFCGHDQRAVPPLPLVDPPIVAMSGGRSACAARCRLCRAFSRAFLPRRLGAIWPSGPHCWGLALWRSVELTNLCALESGVTSAPCRQPSLRLNFRVSGAFPAGSLLSGRALGSSPILPSSVQQGGNRILLSALAVPLPHADAVAAVPQRRPCGEAGLQSRDCFARGGRFLPAGVTHPHPFGGLSLKVIQNIGATFSR